MYQFHNSFRDVESHRDKNIIKVMGEGVVNVNPDVAEVTVGVITENINLEAAQKENADTSKKVIDALFDMGINRDDMQTADYTVSIKYDYVDGKQVFRGYEVSNTIRVSVREISTVGEVIDTAVKNGANYIGNINFINTNAAKYYDTALQLAVVDAQNKAVAITDKLKSKINIVPIRVEERSVASSPTMLKTAQSATPIDPGVNKIVAIIEATFTYI